MLIRGDSKWVSHPAPQWHSGRPPASSCFSSSFLDATSPRFQLHSFCLLACWLEHGLKFSRRENENADTTSRSALPKQERGVHFVLSCFLLSCFLLFFWLVSVADVTVDGVLERASAVFFFFCDVGLLFIFCSGCLFVCLFGVLVLLVSQKQVTAD